MEAKINSIENKYDYTIVNADEIVSGLYIGINELTTFSSERYNRWLAKRYAIDSAYGPKNYPNNDCTNFIS